MEHEDPRAEIPQVESLLSMPEMIPYIRRVSRPLAAEIIARALGDLRRELSAGVPADSVPERARERCEAALEAAAGKRLGKVLNGTGVLLHTNLGRSPLPKSVWSQIEAINTGYSNLELELDSGKRGTRGGLVPELLRVFTGAEGGLLVNNNAAAVLLALSALAAGKEVLVSRGEAVQIGGGFRIPDILALSGARLVEVGTTNVTTVDDYLNAVGPETAMALVVHRSNFALRGFAESPRLSALAKALPPGLPLVVDQGSGFAGEAGGGEAGGGEAGGGEAGFGKAATEEDSIRRIVKSGASLVCFSGDKIFGGPQAGIIVGKAELVARLARHPLMRTFRPGKTILSITEAVLVERLGRDPRPGGVVGVRGAGNAGGAGDPRASGTTAVERALARTREERLAELRAFGRKIMRGLPPGRAELVRSRATIGGGSAPDEFVVSAAIRLKPQRSASRLARALRGATVPLVARIEGEDVFIDLLALADEDPRLVSSTIAEALAMEPTA